MLGLGKHRGQLLRVYNIAGRYYDEDSRVQSMNVDKTIQKLFKLGKRLVRASRSLSGKENGASDDCSEITSNLGGF